MEENLSIAEILSELKELKTKLETMFDESNSNKTRVLLLGPTGVGKTTFTHLIAGCNMTAEKIRGNHNVVLNCKENCKGNNIKIGHTKNAETTLPSLLHNSDVLFCDCPGLLDNRSLQQRILNAFSIDHILAPPCKIKILLLLTQDHFEVDRGKSAIDLIDEAEKFFTDYEQMEKCVGLVITKMNPLNNPAELLDDFQDYTNKHPLLDFFINHPDRCFSVHQPVELGNYNNFHDRSKILSFVKTDVVQNPKHSVIIDDGTIQTLCVECNEMNEKMNDRLLEFSHDLSERCRNVTEISKLNEWINIIKELRSSLSQGIEPFYQKILEYPTFESIQNVLEIFILWNEFFNQVVLKTLPSKDKYLFKCNSIIQTFDNQIEDLQKRRDSAETKIELSRDQNVFSIVQQLDQIIKSAGVINTHEYAFFKFLEDHPVHHATIVHDLPFIACQYDEFDGTYLHIKMNYQSVTILVKQMEIIIIDLLRELELVNDSDVSRSVLEQMRNTNIHPHDIEAFKKYKPSTGNKIISYFEGFAHPVKLITSIPVAIGGKLKPVLKKQRDIDNVDKMNRWFTKGLLSAKISVFQNCIVHMLLKYREFSRIEQQKCSISFLYGGDGYFRFPFFEINPILPNDSLVFLITQCKSMTDLINEANSKNSMDVFRGIESLYLRVCGEIVQRNISKEGFKLFESASRGMKIDDILKELSENITKREIDSDEKIEIYSQILATTRMLGAIHGRGLKSHERANLFGLNTTVNCQSQDGKIRVYCRQNVQDINSTLVSRVKDLMCDIENKPEQQIGDFGPNAFVETTRQYINKLKEQYESSQESLMSSIQSLFAGISSLSNGNTQNEQTSQKGEKLLDDLKKVEGVEVGNKNQNKVDININGSLFKVAISTLLSLAPQISTAVSSTKNFITSKKNYNRICSFKPLISFYQQTTSYLKNENTQGVLINIDDSTLISVDPITLNHEIYQTAH